MRTRLIDRLVLPTIVGLTTVLFSLLLLQRLLTQQGAEIQSATAAQSVFVKSKMESLLKARTLPLQLLGPNDADMKSDVVLLMNGDPTYQAIEWVDPAYRVTWVAPPSKNGSEPGADLNSDARERAALDTARDTGRMVITRPVDLPRGGRGALVVVPLRDKGQQLDGFLVGVFSYQGLFDSILQDVAQDYWISIYDGDEQIYSRAGAVPPRQEAPAQVSTIEFGQLTWRAQVWPKPEKVAYAQSILPQLTFVGGLMMAACLAFAVYMGETAQHQNRELRAEISSREEAEEALRHAQKMEAVGRLAGGVAHDFNNLLMVIRGHAALSLNSFDTDNPLHRHLTDIVKTTDRASSLTRQLLAFSRKQVLQPRVLDLNTLVNQVAELLPPVLGSDISLIIDLDPELGLVKADAAQIEQVIMNLVFNARDAMPGGGELTIRTANSLMDESWCLRHPGVVPVPHVMLAVQDIGHGMSQETQSHIFEPFFTTKDRNKGTGLGLSTVYGTVSQSGGLVTVSSKVGEGTTILIELPRVEALVEAVGVGAADLDTSSVAANRAAAKRSAASASAANRAEAKGAATNGADINGVDINRAASSATPADALDEVPEIPAIQQQLEDTVLVVEDDDAVRRMTREFLKIKGYNVVEVRSALEAIQFLEADKDTVDLVLTDVVMPGMKGRELGQRIAQLRPGIPILYMSAYTEDAIMDYEMFDPGTAFIEKPFSPDELAAKVRKVLAANRNAATPDRRRTAKSPS